MAEIDDLPPYMYCDIEECKYRHFLTLNKDVQGKWSIGYAAFVTDERGISGLCENRFSSVDDAAKWLKNELGDSSGKTELRQR